MAGEPVNDAPFRLIEDVELGDNVTVWSFTNLYGCRVGDNTRIGSFVEIQRGAVIGAACKISSHSFICDGVEIEDEVFVGHGVLFVNDRFPRAATEEGAPKSDAELDPPANGGRARCLARLRSDRPRRRSNRGEGSRRSGRRGHPRRCPRLDRGRRPRA